MGIFSARLEFVRDRKKLLKKQVADHVGMSPQGYGKIESGQREPNLEVLAKFPSILDESVDFLIGVTDFDKFGESLYDNYHSVCFNIATIERELRVLSRYPNIYDYELGDIKPEQIEAHRAKLTKNLTVLSLQKVQFRERLIKYLQKQIPFVSPKTFQKIDSVTSEMNNLFVPLSSSSDNEQ
ncbi:helix-turn-helix domain-containing protein [Paenibacillus taichungensis]